jgi:hypothetical protein
VSEIDNWLSDTQAACFVHRASAPLFGLCRRSVYRGMR